MVRICAPLQPLRSEVMPGPGQCSPEALRLTVHELASLPPEHVTSAFGFQPRTAICKPAAKRQLGPRSICSRPSLRRVHDQATKVSKLIHWLLQSPVQEAAAGTPEMIHALPSYVASSSPYVVEWIPHGLPWQVEHVPGYRVLAPDDPGSSIDVLVTGGGGVGGGETCAGPLCACCPYCIRRLSCVASCTVMGLRLICTG